MSQVLLRFKVCALFTISIASLFSLSFAAQPSNQDKSHHTNGGFKNLHGAKNPGFFDFLKWRWGHIWKDIPPSEAYHFPLAKSDPAFLRSNHGKNTLTWIGHATLLLQLEGKNILTDPHFSQRASPVQWAGPKRVTPPGMPLEDLPPIDIVIISHDHYDSLDKETIVKLYRREGGQKTTFFVPLGLKGWFKRLGISRVFELDWWDQHEEKGLKIIALPVQHWSKRGLFSRNKTLWAGWVVRSPHFHFFFVGDSGYTPQFKELGQKLGPFDLSAIPIGAYEPRWFMRHHHMTPEEAVQVHVDVRSKKSIAIHWGAFILTDEPLDEPPKRLEKAKEKRGLLEEEFLVLKHGETIILSPFSKNSPRSFTFPSNSVARDIP